MITIHEQLRRAKKGEVLFTRSPPKRATSAALRLGREVRTEVCTVLAVRKGEMIRLTRVTVVK